MNRRLLLFTGFVLFTILTGARSEEQITNRELNDEFRPGRLVNQDPVRDPEIIWWFDLDAPSFGSSATDDIDGDGLPEIVFGTYFNDEQVYALNAEDGSLLWSYDTGGCNDASPLIYDVDSDDELEVIVAASSPYHVFCFNGASGDIEWDISTGYPNCIDSPPAAADADNDGRPEIVFGTFYGHVFCINGEDGSVCWQADLGTDCYIQSGPSILDCDDDGQLDVVVAQWQGDCRIYALNGNDGSLLWFSEAPDDWMYHGGAFADIDEDGRPEIAIGCYDGNVYVLNAEDGSLLWEYGNFYYCGGPTSIADLNNDGHLEIVFTTYTTLKVLSHTGNLLWSYNTGGSIFRGAAIADTDGNGILDVVFGSDDGILRVLRGTDGSVVWTYDLETHYGRTYNIDHAPVIADFNNDDLLDVFVIGGYGTSSQPANNHGRGYALTAGDGTGPGWKMFRHDPAHSACFESQEYSAAIELTPYNPPIIVPAEGGRVEFNLAGTNFGSFPIALEIWCDILLPSGAYFGPVLGPAMVSISPGASVNRDRIQVVPGNAPAGTYSYNAYIGNFPEMILSEDSFEFEKSGEIELENGGWSNQAKIAVTEGDMEVLLLDDFFCLRAYPNPFNAKAAISFKLQAASRVELKVHDVMGREVASLVTGHWSLGYHEVVWDAEGMSSGVYLVRLDVLSTAESRQHTSVRKVILLK